jgi:hypothetical protein
MSAGSVMVSTTSIHERRAGSIPSPALQSIIVRPIPQAVAKNILVKNHYLHSLPGCTKLCFGAFSSNQLQGTITFGAGPTNAFRLVDGASPSDCLTLTRLWLSDKLPPNSESRVIAVSLRYLRKYTKLKFLVTYADPTRGHLGIIYQATGWLYTGLSEPTPMLDLGDGIPRHSRSFSHAFGSHSMKYFEKCGFSVKLLPQSAKHRYIYFLNLEYKSRLKSLVLPYPKKGNPVAEERGRVWGSGKSINNSISPCTPLTIVTGKEADEDH